MAYLSYRNGQRTIEDLASQLGREVVARVAKQVQDFTDTPHQFLQINQAAVDTGLLDLADFTSMSQFLWRQTLITPAVPYVYYGNQSGDFVGVWQQPDGITTLRVRDATSAPLRTITKLDEEGKPVEQLQVSAYDPRDRPWYHGAMQARAATWSPIYVFAVPPSLGITASLPLYQETGDLQGVMAVDLTLGDMATFLKETQASPSGHSLILERSGDIVASSVAENPFITTESGESRLPASQSREPLIQEAAQALMAHYGTLDRIQTSQQLTFFLDRQLHFLQVTPFQDGRGLDWLLLVVIPRSDFVDRINANTRNTLFLSLLAFLFAVLAGLTTSRWISNPILQLSEISKAMAQGDLSRQVKVKVGISEVMTLTESFNSMVVQLKQLFETLEDKVQERTAQLATAYLEIRSLNNKLKRENQRMSHELDILRQMQQLILPNPREIEDIDQLDIAGYMDPADEVGGDYYDILASDHGITLGIGDVTGHGLESSILMIMTQTVIRALKEVEDVDLTQLLDILNRTIYKNAQRMNTDKTLTLAVMHYHEGTLLIAGQHEETLVVRKNGSVERIDTLDLGFPIGLQEDIKEFISSTRVQLDPGDGIVLYTDGLTEAENKQGQQYQIERLCQIVSTHWGKSATEIQQAVINDVQNHVGDHKLFDDITIVVLKQK